MKLIYTILFTILLLNVNLNNGQGIKPPPINPLNPSQNVTALSIISDLYGAVEASKVVDICNYTSPAGSGKHFECVKMNNVDEFYTITTITLNNQIGIVHFNHDISAFVNLTHITFNSQFLIMGNWFYNNIDKFQQLQSLYFYNVTGTLSETVELPKSLNQVQFGLLETKIGLNWFNSGIESFQTGLPAPGFQLPTTLNTVNNKLYSMSVTVNQYFNFPTNAAQYLLALDNIQFLVFNDITAQDYQNYSLPVIGQLPKLATLSFDFRSNDENQLTQFWEFPTEYTQLSKLSSFSIERGTGFTLSSGLDLSALQQPIFFSLRGDCELLEGKSPNSFKFPKDSAFYTEQCDYNLNVVDLSNLLQLTVSGNGLEQSLPATIGNNMLYFSITQSEFIGSISESYCSAHLTLSGCEIRGQVPSCIQCAGGANLPNLFPNPFDDFTQTTPPVCNDFSIDQNYSRLISTDETGSLIVTGTDLGWTVDLVNKNNNVYGEFLIPNYKFQLFIGQGDGVGHSIQIYLHKNKTNPITLEYSYIPPVITSYSFSVNEGSFDTPYFTLNGTGFSYVNQNTLTFNGVEHEVNQATEGGGIIFYQNDIFEELVTGDTFSVSIDAGGQKSSTVIFVYFPGSIKFATTSAKPQFNNTGGNALLSGSFATTNINYVTASVNGLPCVVVSVSPTQLNLNYPTSDKLGEFTLTVNIGGRITSTQVDYIQAPPPYQPTTGIPSSSSSSEDVSNASTLSIPLFISILILIINLLI